MRSADHANLIWPWADRKFPLVLVAGLVLGLAVAPWICEQGDMWGCWLPWARITGGLRPWMPYARPDCNYPPFMLYVWTAVEAVERLANVPRSIRNPFAIVLIKLPNLLAYAGGVILCVKGLETIAGVIVARRAALAYALCFPLWFNAAIWGQCDAILSLAMLAVVLALLNQRPMIAGACIGWALSIKLQAIVVVPAAVIYLFCRYGLVPLLRAGGAALGILFLVFLPMVLSGHAHQLRRSYTGAVGQYPFLSIDTFNPWSLVTVFDIYIRHLSRDVASLDTVHWLGPVTPKLVGLLAFSAFTGWLMLGLYRRPTRYNLALVTGLTAYGFYMLTTEMHERYVIPAAALLALCAASGGGRVYLAVMIPALLNQIKGMSSQHYIFIKTSTLAKLQVFDAITLVVSGINVFIFLWICWACHYELFKSSPAVDRFNCETAGEPSSS